MVKVWPWSRFGELHSQLAEVRIGWQQDKRVMDILAKQAEHWNGRTIVLQAELDRAHALNERLLSELLTLKRDGFNPPADVPAVQQDTDIAPEIRSTLHALGIKPGSSEWNEMLGHGEALIAAGHKPAEAAALLRRGGNFNPFH